MRTFIAIRSALLVVTAGIVAGCAAEAVPAAPSLPPVVVDEPPGLGRSASATLRDDAIGYWEAWKRGTQTSRCMADAGFVWRAEVAYPEEVVTEIARLLDIERTTPVDSSDIEAQNARAYLALGDAEKNRYSLALLGETSADMSQVSETGLIPDGRGADFAAGGCVGESLTDVGSVWDLERSVGTDLLEAERAFKESSFGGVRERYAACAREQGLEGVDGPDSIDGLLSAASEADLPQILEKTDKVQAACGDIWAVGSAEAYAAALGSVREKYPDLFDSQEKRYSGALDELAADQEFLRFLATGE